MAQTTRATQTARRRGGAEGPAAGEGRVRLEPALLRELSRVSSLRGLADLFAIWGTIGLALGLAHTADRWWAYLLAALIVASRQNALVSLAHEAFHRLCLRSRDWNDRIGAWACAYPVGVFYHHDRRRHLRHHREVGAPHDPDWVNYTNEGRETPGATLRYLVALLFGLRLFQLARSVLFDRAPRIRLEEAGGAAHSHELKGDMVSMGVCQIALFGLFTLLFEWWTYPLLWVLPLVTLASFLVNLRAFLEHVSSDEHAPGPLRLRDFAANPLEAFFLSPLHFHYHALHHAFVSVPHRNLPEVRRTVAGGYGTYPIEVWPGYLRSLQQHLKSLKEVETEAALPPPPAATSIQGDRQPLERLRVACEHCGASEGKPVTSWLLDQESADQLPPAFRNEAFHFVRCEGCGLVYMPERPNPGDLDVFYGVEYKCFESFDDRGALMRLLARLVARRKLRLIEELMPPGRRSLLDYGCGAGTWLEIFRAVGTDLEMSGCDVTEVAVARTQEKGFPAWVCDDTTLHEHVEPGSVGVIHLFHVVEHVPHVGRCMNALYDALAPGGAVLGQTPNIASWGCRFWGDHWAQWHVPRHLVLFDHATLRRAAENAGFEVVEIKSSLSGATQWALSALAWWAARRGRPFRTGHEPFYPPLILAFLPVATLEALFAHTCHMDFVLRKPANSSPS